MIPERTFKNHEYDAAGRRWIIPSVKLAQLPGSNDYAISLTEIQRIHRGIIHALCTDPTDLTFAEFEFLCDATETTQTEAATVLGLHKSALSKWKARDSGPTGIMSSALKRFFWFKHFAERVSRVKAPLKAMATDTEILRYVRDHTKESDLDAPIVRAA
jgi:DNA-binding transcriptional regulator YiaG